MGCICSSLYSEPKDAVDKMEVGVLILQFVGLNSIHSAYYSWLTKLNYLALAAAEAAVVVTVAAIAPPPAPAPPRVRKKRKHRLEVAKTRKN